MDLLLLYSVYTYAFHVCDSSSVRHVYFSPVMYHHTLQHLSHYKTVLLEVITKTTKYIPRALNIKQKPSQPDTEGLSGNMQSSGTEM